MFSLVVTIIAIALVVALAAATMYYVGLTTSKGQDELAAAALLTQTEQISAALTLRATQREDDVVRIAQLVTEGYLSTVPNPVQGAYVESKKPSAADWWVLKPQRQPAVLLETKIKTEVCIALNKKFSGKAEIHEYIDPALRIQCFGAAEPFSLVLNQSGKAQVLEDAVNSWNSKPIDSCAAGVAYATPALLPDPSVARPCGAEPVLPGPVAGGGPVVASGGDTGGPGGGGGMGNSAGLLLAQATIPAWTVGTSGSFDFSPLLSLSSGQPITPSQVVWTGIGALPGGLTLSASTGVLSGTPTQATAGMDFTVKASYSGSSVQQTYKLVVNASGGTAVVLDAVPTGTGAVALAPATIPAWTVGGYGGFDLKGLFSDTREPSPDRNAITWGGVGTLPAGLSLNPSTGVISGTPTQGTEGLSYAVTATYKGDTAAQVYDLVVKPSGTPAEGARLASAPVISGQVNSPLNFDFKPLFSDTREASPAMYQIAWSTEGILPAGLFLDKFTGVLFGTPTVSGLFNVTVVAEYKGSIARQNYTLRIEENLTGIWYFWAWYPSGANPDLNNYSLSPEAACQAINPKVTSWGGAWGYTPWGPGDVKAQTPDTIARPCLMLQVAFYNGATSLVESGGVYGGKVCVNSSGPNYFASATGECVAAPSTGTTGGTTGSTTTGTTGTTGTGTTGTTGGTTTGTAGTTGITILSASYGYNVNTSLEGNLTSALATACNGKVPCSFMPFNLIGDPASGWQKHTKVSYTCGSSATVVLYENTNGETGQVANVLECPTVLAPGETLGIIVTAATYGYNVSSSLTGNLTSSLGLTCDGLTSCTFSPYALIGDPAYGSGKYTQVSYKCSPTSAEKTVTFTYEGSMQIACV